MERNQTLLGGDGFHWNAGKQNRSFFCKAAIIRIRFQTAPDTDGSTSLVPISRFKRLGSFVLGNQLVGEFR